MRLSAEQVKGGILHPEQDVREAAIYYFARSYQADSSIMPLVIRAVEQFGFDSAFRCYSFLSDLTQTEATARWLIDQLQRVARSDQEPSPPLLPAYRTALIHADVALLQAHEQQIMALDSLDDAARDAVSERIGFLARSPAELWRELEEFCLAHEGEQSLDREDAAFAGRVAEAIGRHPTVFADRVLSILACETGDFGELLEGFAVRLAGEMQMERAVPWLVALLHDADIWLCEECLRALVKMGGDDVVARLAQEHPHGRWDFRLSVASILENLHSDRSVQTGLDLLTVETDHSIRCYLLQAVLLNFATEGIEPARAFILGTPLDPEVLDVRTALLTTCKLTGERFPEFDAWLEDSRNDTAFRRQWHAEHRPPQNPEDLDDSDEEVEGEDARVPGWLEGLVEVVADSMTAHGLPGPLGIATSRMMACGKCWSTRCRWNWSAVLSTAAW